MAMMLRSGSRYWSCAARRGSLASVVSTSRSNSSSTVAALGTNAPLFRLCSSSSSPPRTSSSSPRRPQSSPPMPPSASSPSPQLLVHRKVTEPFDATTHRETEPLTSAESPLNHVTKLNTTPASELEEPPLDALPPAPATTWRERAKTFAIEYGRVGVGTHIVLSLASFSFIYIGVSSGVDVTALLDTVGFSVATSESAANSAGSFVIAYAMYKLLAPVRWPLTFAVTPVVMRALRRRGYMLPPPAAAVRTTHRSPPPASPDM